MKYIAILLITTCTLFANDLSGIKAMGAPLNPKVDVRWNRFYDFDAITKISNEMAKKYPHLVKKEAIGKSHEGRELFVLKITDWSTGSDLNKPAMYIDGNIHSNEIQGSEASLYTAWYLTEMYGQNAWIKQLLHDKVFYIVPSINPDGRNFYMQKPNSASSPRSGMIPTDNDLDGEIDEDGPDDLDGDGHIVSMRIKDPNGQYISHPDYPEYMVRVKPGQRGDYRMMRSEGYDNDGDGRINEDGHGYFDYDPNRDWAWRWEPQYIQRGARRYPFSIPSNQAVEKFAKAHKNIVGAQTYHNSGGMILRGPGKNSDKYDRQDVRLYDYLGKMGETILPDYRYMIVWKDLYEVFGGEVDWFYGSLGATTFTNELWTSTNMFRNAKKSAEKIGDRRLQSYIFNKHLLFGEAFIPWHTVKHPQLGEVEVGGFKKNTGRTSPSFLLEEECHRNMSFTLFHAYSLPQVRVGKISHTKLANGLYEIHAEITNDRVLPTRLNHDIKNKISAPDLISLNSKKVTVVAGLVSLNEAAGTFKEQKKNPKTIKLDVITGLAVQKIKWLVKGHGSITIDIKSEKGGIASKTYSF